MAETDANRWSDIEKDIGGLTPSARQTAILSLGTIDVSKMEVDGRVN